MTWTLMKYMLFMALLVFTHDVAADRSWKDSFWTNAAKAQNAGSLVYLHNE